MSGMIADTITLTAPFAGWLAPLDAVPDAVFAERMMGEGFAIDPTEGVLRAPAAGEVLSVPESAHAVTLRLDNGAELLLHIGLDTVALGGEGFDAKVFAGQRVAAGDVLIAFDLDAVAVSAKALITPVVVANDGYVLRIEQPGRLVDAGAPVAVVHRTPAKAGAQPHQVRESGAAVESTSELGPGLRGGTEERAERTVAVSAVHGIHARPAARIAATLRPFVAEVTLATAEDSANARSSVALLGLGVGTGSTVRIVGVGPDARAAVDAVAELILSGLGEAASAPALPVVRTHGPVTASPGLAIGQALQLRAADQAVPDQGGGIADERVALDTALSVVAGGLAGTRGPAAEIAEAHRALLDDPELRRVAGEGIAAGHSAAFAWRSATVRAAEAIRATGDALLIERIADLKDLERQVIAALLGTSGPDIPALRPHTILIAEDLLPSQFLSLDTANLAGICTAAGGPTSHVAILAASAGIPMLVAAGDGVLAIGDGTPLILDADAAILAVEPSPEALAEASERLSVTRERRAREAAAAHEPCRMADGTRIEIFANLGSVADAAAAIAAGAEGCGLLRTEFLFLDRDTAPDEEEQRETYSRIAATLGDRPLIVRTLDIGGDKPVPYLPMAGEDNPALGLRGVRLSLARPDLMRLQLGAILRGVPAGQCRIMLPMVADLGDYRPVRALLDEVRGELDIADRVQLGVMIETPAAAMLAGQIAREADFLSIGTNDLTQYTLAADRGNAAVSQRIDAMHPAVLRLVREVGKGAKDAGRWAGMCGGLASDPLAAPILIGLGITELSATPAAIPGLKAVVRTLDMQTCAALAEKACDAASAAEVRTLAREALA
ncbi:phosphoenolpyruvate--protein phosphotransferase [Sphingomonas sp. HF-S4]|uniref:phosphoenolpyruvate--protein phosphotransferase n=1 Tax=Sphingomonas agrestis TaxID=3080540 RepID=A0ABU3Y7H5_9SPHN|nr:phosphoenolpyruvate--protein phosphotransferase [Sphingomonas sp. HF-S4]MDV3457133.1 phosphoenolpyruvate--protein phosphotransferase [Sphingomonas sp. HF-S4]